MAASHLRLVGGQDWMTDEPNYGPMLEYRMGLQPDELEARRSQVGSSDIGSIVGVNPYAGPRAVYDSKVGTVVVEPNDRMILGTVQEPATIAAYAALHHRKIWQPGVKFLEGSEICATRVDALAGGLDSDKPDVCVEAKNVHIGLRDDWGPDHTHMIPVYYRPQVQWHMGIWGLDKCDVLAMIGGDLHVYHVRADPVVFGLLVEAAERFWRDHVVAGVRPGPDGTRSCTDDLQRIPHKDEAVLAATATTEQLIAEIVETGRSRKAAKAHEDALRNDLREAIGTNQGIRCGRGSASWKMARGRSKIDWQALAESFDPSPETLEKFITTTAGSRRLVVRGSRK